MRHADYDMETDVLNANWLCQKIRTNTAYAQSFYAGLCNNLFHKTNAPDDAICSFSWRHAGAVVADIRKQGDYLDWYCSGLVDSATPEGEIVPEIAADIEKLGWEIWTEIFEKEHLYDDAN